MKKGRLTNNEKYIILGMTQQDKSLEEIVTYTKRDEKTIIDFLASTVKKTEESIKAQEQEKTKPDPEKRLSKIKNNKRKKTSRYQRLSESETKRGVSVMTSSKSMITDSIRSNPKLGKAKQMGAIYHPKDGTID